LAAPLLCAGVTVFAPLKKYLNPGDKVAVLGIGGLGHLAVQYASKMGHEVTAFTSSNDKNEYIYNLGAKYVVDINNVEELKKHASEFDVTMNTLPHSKDFSHLISMTGPEGKFVQMGAPENNDNLNFSARLLLRNEVNLVGSIVGSRQNVSDMLEFSVKNNIYPSCEEFPFENFDKALDRIENGRPKFRCVVNVKDYKLK